MYFRAIIILLKSIYGCYACKKYFVLIFRQIVCIAFIHVFVIPQRIEFHKKH